jgi:hypothetical protein
MNPEFRQDPSQFPVETERPPETEGDIARRLMTGLASEVNEALGEKVVGPDGRLKMFMYGGTLGEDRVQLDSAFVRSRKAEWAGLDEPLQRQQEIQRLGLTEKVSRNTEDQITDAILRAQDIEQAGRSGNLAEVAATMLLHRGLREQFLVVRTAAYDDLKHGLDTMVVNKETGEVICAFDEVMGGENDPRVKEKQLRQQEAIERGGVDLDYGFTLSESKMIKRSFKNVPVFRLRLGRVEVNAALSECDTTEGLGPLGGQMLDGLLNELETQTNEYLASPKLQPAMREKLEQYRDGSLPLMRQVSSQQPHR